MSEIDLVVFDLAGTTIRDADHVTAAFITTLGTLGLPIAPAEIEAVRGTSKRDAIEALLLRYSPEQANAEMIDRLFKDFNRRLEVMQREHGVRPVEGAEEVFRWLRGRGIKVALTTGFDRKTVKRITKSLKWGDDVVDAVVCSEDVKTGRPAPYMIFRAMELTGAQNVKRVAVLGDTVNDLQAADNAAVEMNIGVFSGAHSKELLEKAPHTHLIESVRKFPPLLAGGPPAAESVAPPPEALAPPPPPPPTPPTPPSPPPTPPSPPPPPPTEPGRSPADPLGPGFKPGSGLP